MALSKNIFLKGIGTCYDQWSGLRFYLENRILKKMSPDKPMIEYLGNAPTWSERQYVRINRADIATLKFILEGYDHLAVISVLDKYEAVLLLRYAPGQQEEVQQFLAGMSNEIYLEKVSLPCRERS